VPIHLVKVMGIKFRDKHGNLGHHYRVDVTPRGRMPLEYWWDISECLGKGGRIEIYPITAEVIRLKGEEE